MTTGETRSQSLLLPRGGPGRLVWGVFLNPATKVKLSLGLLAAVTAFGGLARKAYAGPAGGVTHINQSNVPYTIDSSGSYKLTSDLFVSNGLFGTITTAIKVNVPNVTIDLNGFSILGNGSGSGSQGLTNGIDASGQPLITILNGEVANMSNFGISTGHSSRIERVRAFGNGDDGIDCTDGCEITNCILNNNGRYGLLLADSSGNGRGVVSSNVVQYNALVGINLSTAALVTGNSVSNNLDGIRCANGHGAYSNNVLDANGHDVVGCLNLGQNACSGSLCP